MLEIPSSASGWRVYGRRYATEILREDLGPEETRGPGRQMGRDPEKRIYLLCVEGDYTVPSC